MTTEEPPPGTIITFYSYKGGTGRSMAVANAACWLGRKVLTSSQKVLVMDWDLEAPGLHRFFVPQTDHAEHVDRPGIINYFGRLQKKLIQDQGFYAELVAEEGWRTLDRELPLDDYLIPEVLPGVDFIKAGEFDAMYAELVSTFNWVGFYSQFGNVIETFRNLIASKYAYCLIDSRTGFTDISGICTMLMPEKLVMVFTPSRQSLSGVIDLAVRATAYRRASDDFRPLSVFPLPSRIENAELSLKKDWRERYQTEFEETFCKIYELEKCELSDYFDEVQLPHMAYYSYGESIALLEERSDALSLSRAYENFFQRLTELDFPWVKQDAIWDMPEKAQTEITLAPDARLSKYTEVKLISYANENIFFSYAPDDNASLISNYRGWTDTLLESLTMRLSQLLGESPYIWRDKTLSANPATTDTLIVRLSRPTLLVAVLSPTYINSLWCLKELDEFHNRAIERGGITINNKPPIFKVVKSPVEYNRLPPHLREVLQASSGYEFYEIDKSSGKLREFWPELGPDYLKKFLDRLEDLAQDIKAFINSQQTAPAAPGYSTGIYLAETTPELSVERNEIKRTLQLHNYRVLPDENLPFEDSAFEEMVRRCLEQSTLSIHLIGSDHTVIPAEGPLRAKLDLQHQLAAQRVRKQHELAMSHGDRVPTYSRLIWMPEELQARTPAYQYFIAYLQNDPAVYEGAEVLLGVSVEDLKTIIYKKLGSRHLEGGGERKSIYLMCDKLDINAAAPLRAYLSEQQYEVLLPFKEGSEIVSGHNANLRLCDAVLIFYGSAETIDYKLKSLGRSGVIRNNKPLLAKGVYVSGPETEQKRNFHTDEAVVMKDFGEFSPESIRPFLEQIGQSLDK
jgi:cellulose biosynthesis protein BcsQ